MQQIENKIKSQNGITLLVLVITIIILLILAGITINAITADNGIINNAGRAKEEAEIANEKEIVEKATVQAMENNKYGNIEKSELQSALDKQMGEGKTETDDVGEEFEVGFLDSKRYYTVDKDGNVTGPQDIVEDKSPGDITKDKNGNDIKEGQPYEIWCIEDLCAFSNLVNNESVYSTVMLMRDLNFNSKYSYVNGTIEVDGNIPSCNSIEELQKALTENEGFYPIRDSLSTSFRGIFDGNNKAIKNIYINRPDMLVGLFGRTSAVFGNNIIIKNLSIFGNMTGSDVGSIFANVVTNNIDSLIKIENCISNVKIKGSDHVGGIIGINSASSQGNLIIANCINKGTINGKKYVGGILGHNYNNTKIINCYNSGNVAGESDVGGIVGHNERQSNIINSYNLGNIKANSNAGGESQEDINGISDTEIKSSEILEKLNEYVETVEEKESIQLKKWVQGSDGYPTFEFSIQ